MKLNYAFNIGWESAFWVYDTQRWETEERKAAFLMKSRFKFMFGTTIFHKCHKNARHQRHQKSKKHVPNAYTSPFRYSFPIKATFIIVKNPKICLKVNKKKQNLSFVQI